MKHTNQLITNYRHSTIKRWCLIVGLVLLVAGAGVYGYIHFRPHLVNSVRVITGERPTPTPEIKTGKIIEEQVPVTYTTEETKKLIHETNKQFNLPVDQGITKQLIRYNSSDGSDSNVPVYARVYRPLSVTPGKTLPIFSFAPGTTGIDDHCAASLEVAAKSNWANYDSLMAAYASQGYVVVTIDYEGMRDTTRLHHYMVGELEGRAVLDSIRSLKNLKNTKDVINTDKIALAGYSQGGHAAYWADKIAPDYARELNISGVVGFGPVSSVKETWADITRGANINWFGPFVLASYSDYYKQDYMTSEILQNKWSKNLSSDVAKNCIDTVIGYWGKKPDQVYEAKFLAALKNDNLAQVGYGALASDLEKNKLGNTMTKTAKLINQGVEDNVILPRQSMAFRDRLCAAGNKNVSYKAYRANHYNTMVISFNDTMAWMGQVLSGQSPPTACN